VRISRRLVADTFDLLGAMLADRCVASEGRDTKAKDANQLQLPVELAALRNTENF
jgi:hypothetical protein